MWIRKNMLFNMKQKISGSVLSVHALKVAKFLFVIFLPFSYKNLKISKQIYHYFDTFTTAAYFVYY